MKAILLSAGYGTRLRPLTYFVPKCLIKVKGKSVIERNIEYLNRSGITDIMVNLHYKPLQVMKKLGSKVKYFYEPKLLGEEGTIKALKDWIDDYTVVMNADTLTNLDLNKMIGLTNGANTKYMDGEVYAGVRLINPFSNKEAKYYDAESWWVDMGTFKGLRRANDLCS